MSSIEQLIQKCIHNDEEAKRTLFNKVAPRIMGICRKFTHSNYESDDIFQETFIKIFKNLIQYSSGKGSFDAWISKIATNEALLFIKKRMKERNIAFDNTNVEDSSISYNGVDENLSQDQLMEMLDQLPIGMKTVFVLYVVEGYAHDEIAEMLDITIGTSKSQLFKAKKKLMELHEKFNKIKEKRVL